MKKVAGYTITARPCALTQGQYRWIILPPGGSEAERSPRAYFSEAAAMEAGEAHVRDREAERTRRQR